MFNEDEKNEDLIPILVSDPIVYYSNEKIKNTPKRPIEVPREVINTLGIENI
jgi:hypothetical protein